MKLKIITIPNPILRRKSKPIKKINRKINQLAEKMIQIIKFGYAGQPVGVGLSAVQVSRLIRLFVAYDPEKNRYLAFINPEITQRSKKLITGVPERENKFEGCLSVPGLAAIIKRNQWIKLRYQTLEKEKKEQKFEGFLATVIQHEYDHLEGILFLDRVSEQKGKLYQIQKTPTGENLAETEIPDPVLQT
jgi:peptide deformylase